MRPTQYVNFIFYKVRPEWRHLSPSEQAQYKCEFNDIINSFKAQPGTFLLTYSLVGLRATADFMLWRIAEDLETLQNIAAKLMQTSLGKYLEVTESFLSITKRSSYVDKLDPEHQNSRIHIIPGRRKYLFVYPFVKTRDWYQLSMHARQGMMDEHIEVGNRYPSVKLNTTYSFGIDDQDFVVAFEADDARDFLNLVQELRETEASRYTTRDTPMFTCISHPNALSMLDLL